MRALFVLCLVVRAAVAAPLAAIDEDVDGNGTVDHIELAADGMLRIGDATNATVQLGAASEARLRIARSAGQIQIVVDQTVGSGGQGKREASVLDRRGGWHVATKFPLGGVGLDREYGYELDTSDGVVRYQTRSDIRRCDDRLALLFAERLDGTTFRRIDRLASGVPAGSVSLTAKPDASPGPLPVIFQARAASYQPGAADAGDLVIPHELDDGRLDTVWREDLASAGEGQFFTFRSRVDGAAAVQLRIVPGHPASPDTMRASGRPQRIAIVAKQGVWRVELPDAATAPLASAYTVELPANVTDCVTVVLESAYGRGPTTIAELGVYAADERTGGAAPLLVRVVADGRGGEATAAAALSHLGGAAVNAIGDELARTKDGSRRHRLVGALVKVADPAASALLARVVADGWLADHDLLDVIRALRAQPATLRELATNPRLSLEVRVAAVQAIAPQGAGIAVLGELAGRGAREIRRAVIDRLALAKTDELITLISSAADNAAAGDVWRAVTRSARRDAAARPAAVATMVATLATASDYERRYRLVDGIATLGDAAALATLDRYLRALPSGAERAALYQVAIGGLAAEPRVEAAPLVIAAAQAPEPGIRLAAIAALAASASDSSGPWHGADGPAAIDRVLINAMTDKWAQIRRRSASALASRCQRSGPARVLFEAVAKDRDLDVRGDALVALVGCRATGVSELLRVTWETDKQPLQLRQQAINLVVTLGDRALASLLVQRFTAWRGQAIESKDAMVLAQSAAATIGRMAIPGAAEALVAALDDVAFPEIVSAAALGLGALGPACPASARTKLEALSRSDDRSAVVLRRAAQQCGSKPR